MLIRYIYWLFIIHKRMRKVSHEYRSIQRYQCNVKLLAHHKFWNYLMFWFRDVIVIQNKLKLEPIHARWWKQNELFIHNIINKFLELFELFEFDKKIEANIINYKNFEFVHFRIKTMSDLKKRMDKEQCPSTVNIFNIQHM